MTDSAPPVVDRIVASLRAAGGPRSSADLAREFLGLGIVDESLAQRLLEPVLGADPRLRRSASGWALADSSGARGAAPLTGPFLAVFARQEPRIAGARVFGDGSPAFSVSLGGEREVQEYERQTARRAARPVVSLSEMARRLRGYCGRSDAVSIAEHLKAAHQQVDSLAGSVDLVATCLEHLAAELELEGITTLDELTALLDARLEPACFNGKDFTPDDILRLNEGPGIYIFRAFDARVLYVGQSSQLRARVSSYFRGMPRDTKDRLIRDEATSLEAHELDTGLDALIAEARTIERLAPRVNTRRSVLGESEEDGILMLPARGERAVLYTIAGGLMRRRSVAGRGPRRRQRAVERAVEALVTPPRCAQRRREDAALAATWRRLHPRSVFVRLGIDGDRHALSRRLLDALE